VYNLLLNKKSSFNQSRIFKVHFWYGCFIIFCLSSGLCFQPLAFAVENLDIDLPNEWSELTPLLKARVSQQRAKMKISKKRALSFNEFLESLDKEKTKQLLKLKNELPKTTLELLMAVHERGLSLKEANRMAEYLSSLVNKFSFQTPKPFDENTSHIIGREWHEIDYSGENLTWQKQKAHYLPYGIKDFKSKENLEKFFRVESKLPYFRKIYRPKYPNSLN
jgi:hypothetical protein